uniref:Uncharacterized protein n=1 Tax=Arundo donax TaxID=35708 RepID=A0A0A9S6V4_ARUDO
MCRYNAPIVERCTIREGS